MAWYYSFTHKRGSEDVTTWLPRIRGMYPADALVAEAGGLCVVAVAAGRRNDAGKIDNHNLPYDMTQESIALLLKEPARLLGNARLVWFEPWMLASLQEVVTDIARTTTETSQAIDSLAAKISQTIRGTDRGSMS
jgi:hypothetical protein